MRPHNLYNRAFVVTIPTGQMIISNLPWQMKGPLGNTESKTVYRVLETTKEVSAPLVARHWPFCTLTLQTAETQTHCLCHPLSRILLFLLQTGTDAIHSQHTANTNVVSLHWQGKLLCLQKHLEEGEGPEGGKRKGLVVPAQLSTLPPKLDSSLLLWVQSREPACSACSPAPPMQSGPSSETLLWKNLTACLLKCHHGLSYLLCLQESRLITFNVQVEFFFFLSQ